MGGEDNLQSAGADLDPVARHKRPTAAPFGSAVDPNPSGLDQRLGLATGLDDLCPLEKRPKLNTRRGDWHAVCGHLVPGGSWPCQL